MTNEEKLLAAVSYGLALCAIATRREVISLSTDVIQSKVDLEARLISKAVMDEFHRLKGV